MKYRIDAYKKGGAVKQGIKLLDNIDETIKLAYAVANHYKCYTRIARLNSGYLLVTVTIHTHLNRIALLT